MKSKFLTIILYIIMIFLIIALAVVGVAIYMDFIGEDSSAIIYEIENIATEKPENTTAISATGKLSELNLVSTNSEKTSKDETSYSSDINSRYFYNQLSNEQKNIYNGLQNNKNNLKKGDYVINYGDIFPNSTTEEEGSKKLGDDYQTAVEAFIHDNADLFYLDVNKMYLNIERTTKYFQTTHNIYISPATGRTYLSDDFTSTEQIDAANEKIEEIKNIVLNRLTGTDYQNISYIHDFLVNSIEYDTTYNALGTHSIYGALIEKKCVCEGYMKAFKYLANAAGYECEMMQGTATNSSGQTESHAWNCIKYNGTWYQVDVTWDDPIIIGNGILSDTSRYKYFLKGTRTFEKDHVISYQFSDNGKLFSYPLISSQDY